MSDDATDWYAVPEPPPPPTPQEERVGAAYVASGGDVAKAAKVAGVTKRAAGAMLRKPAMRAYLATFLDEAGATLESAAKVIADAQKAQAIKFFAFEGVVTDEKTVIDHGIRLQAAEMNLKARGQLKDGANVQVNVYAELSDEALAQIALGAAAPEEFLQGELA